MTRIMTTAQSEFHGALHASARAADIDPADDIYGWLIGSWDMDVLHYRVDLGNERRRGEIHVGWVLEGRAIQDVWIMPPRDDTCRTNGTGQPREKHNALKAPDTMYGTTLRIWDPALHAWRVTYLNPQTGQRDELTGRRIGDDLVQIGTHANGTPIRWNFTDITRDSFRWTGVALAADGVTWTLEAEFHARRRGSPTLR